MTKERNKQIDGLKGIMAVLIVIYHLFCRYQQLYHDSNIEFMKNWGTYGVCVFLMVSGYLLANEEPCNQFSLIHYYKRKFLRLWPSYFAALLLISIIVYISNLPNNNVSLKDFILNLFWINGFIGTPYIEGAHWYMTALVSIISIFGLLRKLHLDRNPYAFFMILVLNSIFQKINFTFLSIVLGGGYIGVACCGIAIHNIEMEKGTKIKISWVLLVMVSLFFTWKVRGVQWVIGIIGGIIIFGLCIKKQLPFLEKRFFYMLGMISYQLYLVHQNIGFAVEYRLQMIIGGYSYGFAFVALIVTLALATILHSSMKKWKLV